MRRVFCVVTFLVLLGVSNSEAQTPSTGAQLSGTIVDPSGALIRGATVTLRSEATALVQSTTSDDTGRYRFLLIPAGRYSLTVEAAGFGKLTSSIALTVGQSANFPVALQVAQTATGVTVSTEKRKGPPWPSLWTSYASTTCPAMAATTSISR